MKNFVVLDLETTGLTPKTDRILEIGAVKVVDGEIKERYSTFINPQMEIPRRITELTGITGDMVKDAPLREEAVRGLVEFCQELPLLGHNILFDYSFVKHDAVNLGLVFEKERWTLCRLPVRRFRSWRAAVWNFSAVTMGSAGKTPTAPWTTRWRPWICTGSWKNSLRGSIRNGFRQSR